MKSSNKTSMTHLLLFEDFRYVLTLLISLFAMLLNYALVQLAVTAVGVKNGGGLGTDRAMTIFNIIYLYFSHLVPYFTFHPYHAVTHVFIQILLKK